MEELGPDEQKWLDVLRVADEPRETDRARVRAAVLASLGATSAVGAGAATAAGATKAIASSGGFTKVAASGVAKAAGLFGVPWKVGVVVVSLVVASAGTGAGVLLSRASDAPGPSGASSAVNTGVAATAPAPAEPPTTRSDDAPGASASEEPSVIGATATAASGAEATAPAGPLPRRPRARTSKGHGAPDDVDAELVLLTQAQQALARGDPAAALQALTRHAREHPRGALSVEREGLRAVASCEARPKSEGGAALAERFIAANPRSPLVARVRAACLPP